MASGKILIVDDDTNICELLRLYIEKEGFEASIANDGETALKMFDSVKPDLILLDIMLPGLDGWQVCREIRKKSNRPHHHAHRQGRGVRQGAGPGAGRRRLCGKAL